jgi:hypothetical protein
MLVGNQSALSIPDTTETRAGFPLLAQKQTRLIMQSMTDLTPCSPLDERLLARFAFGLLQRGHVFRFKLPESVCGTLLPLCIRPWSFARQATRRNDGIVPLICPTCQTDSENPYPSWRQPPATLHGVVFDILMGRSRKPSMIARNRCASGGGMVDAQGIEPWTSPV